MDKFMTMSTEDILKDRKNWTYVRTDRNGTRYFFNYTCGRCGGRGFIDCYRFIDGGRCFECGGSGTTDKPETIKVYTPEHAEKLRIAREARAAKREAERIANAKATRGTKLTELGFGCEDGVYVIYRVIGDTFSIKDDLKAAGCKFKPQIGWYASHNLEGYECQRMIETELLTDNVFIEWKSMAEIKALWQYPKSDTVSEYQGKVGERITRTLTIDRRFESHYQYGSYAGASTTSYYYVMHDAIGNKYSWSTAHYFNEKEEITVVGTVKEHKDYRDEHQTVITRCKVQD